jgi:nucleotide-binding universal stress UspA family protein
MSSLRRSIIVGVDASREAIEAARVAASLARRLDHNLVLACVADEPEARQYVSRGASESLRRRAVQRATDRLTTVATEIGEEGARKRVALARPGDDRAYGGLANLVREEDADLLVVGSDGHSAPLGGLGASTTASLLKSSPCPVIVVPAGAANRFAGRRSAGPVICGIDWSLGSGAARVVAEGLAGQLGLAVAPIYVDQIGPWTNTLQGVQVEVGDPAEVLARAAERERASLIVVGMRGRETLIPSVSRGLAAMCPVPVLIVPPDSRLPRFTTAAEMEPIRVAELVQAA